MTSAFLAESTALHASADDDAYYLLAGPGDYSVIEAGFLNGTQTPTVEDGELDFSTLGYPVRAYHDFGVAYLEHRGGVLSAGD